MSAVRKYIRSLLAVAVALVTGWCSGAGAFESGPPSGHAGVLAESDCTACHFDNGANGRSGGVMLSGVPTSYLAGQQYTISVMLVHDASSSGGFQLTIQDANGDPGGKLNSTSDDVKTACVGDNDCRYIQHNKPRIKRDGESDIQWTVVWTAPESKRDLIIGVAAVAANDDASALGDFVFTESAHMKPDEKADAVTTAELILPPGFEAMVVFEGTGESREIYVREDGDLFVSLAGLTDAPQILGLRDEDGDYRIDTIEKFYHVTTPPSQRPPQVHIEYFNEYLYAVENEQLVRMHLPAGQLLPDGPTEVVVEQIPYQRSHRGRTLSIDGDGWVYVNIGAPSNVCQSNSKATGSPGLDPCPQLEQHAGIWRWRGDVLHQTREDGELFAGGIRNAIAQTWDPVYGGLYVGQMGRDRLDSLWPEKFTSTQNAELPSEEFFRAENGQNYGWPYCYFDHQQGRKVLAPEYGGDGVTVGRCDTFSGPQVAFPGHYSPSSIAFYHGEQFPRKYRGGAFVALKGSWNRAPMPQDGYIVAFLPFNEGVPTGAWETFADGFKGFETLYERGNAEYRPQSVFIHPDGSLYVLDNNRGRIWRVTYSGADHAPQAAIGQARDDRKLIVTASQGNGADIYAAHCAACHQLQGGGVPGEFPPLKNSDWVSGDKGRMIATVLHGVEGPIEIDGEIYDELMPGFAFLGDEDMAALLTFIRSSFDNSAEPVHESEVLLVRSSEDRESPWNAIKLKNRTGLIAR